MGGRPAGRTPVRLSLLREWRLEVAGHQVGLPDRPRRLLALLGLRGEQPRALAAGTLWPETTQDRALGSLRVAVWQVTHAVDDVLEASPRTLGLHRRVRIDVQDLVGWAAAVVTGPPRSTRPASTPPLPGLARDGDLLPGWYDDWVVAERERLHHLRLTALQALAETLLRQRRPDDALDVALTAARAEPLRERSHQLVIRSHLARDDAAAALEHYRRVEALLAAELGVPPSPALHRLVEPLLVPVRRPRPAATLGT